MKLKHPIYFETTFARYEADELLGEGGAGRVYGGIGINHAPVAIKILAPERVTTEKRARFKNEISFLAQNVHPNIVSVTDHGISLDGKLSVPFYVMRRYDLNLRSLMERKIPSAEVLPLFGSILDGVEAAHLKGAVHRDLKPENILCSSDKQVVAIADFGIASFTDDILATTVDTGPTQRLANFMYAAPEQRRPGIDIKLSADLYALGLILNEMFTGEVPHGANFKTVVDVQKEFSFLDEVIARLIQQSPEKRPKNVAEVKGLIQRYNSEFNAAQRVSEISKTVIKVGEVDEPLAHDPPRLVGFDWDHGTLTLTLDRPVNHGWVAALHNMGNYTSIMGAEPQRFSFSGDVARVVVRDDMVQGVINNFKNWLPAATRVLRSKLEADAREEVARRNKKLNTEREAEERRLKLLKTIKI